MVVYWHHWRSKRHRDRTPRFCRLNSPMRNYTYKLGRVRRMFKKMAESMSAITSYAMGAPRSPGGFASIGELITKERIQKIQGEYETTNQ